jgi:hypothetical protein
MDKTFYGLLFKQEATAAPVTSTFSSLSHSSKRHLLEIKRLYHVIIISLNNNNAGINNDYGNPRPYFTLQNPQVPS